MSDRIVKIASTPGFDITERCIYFAYTMTQSIDQLHLLVLNVATLPFTTPIGIGKI